MTVFFCVTSVYSLVCFVLKLHRKMSVTFSDRSFHFCTYSVYYCSTKMFSFELTPFACPFSEFTSPVRLTVLLPKKDSLHFSLSHEPSDIPAVAVMQWNNGSDGQRTRRTQLDLAKKNEKRGRFEAGTPTWGTNHLPVSQMGIPPGQLRCINACRLQAGLLCARALCVEMVSDLSSAEL